MTTSSAGSTIAVPCAKNDHTASVGDRKSSTPAPYTLSRQAEWGGCSSGHQPPDAATLDATHRPSAPQNPGHCSAYGGGLYV